MSDAHTHDAEGHGHDHTAGANAKMLGWALALTSLYLVAEVIGGFVFNSLALLSDAAHMMTDVAALVIALLAIKLGQKPADDKRTFGYRRFEILAAAFNAVLLFFIAIYVFVEAIKRFTDPQEVICPLLSGPGYLLFWVMKEIGNAVQEAQARRDHRQAA